MYASRCGLRVGFRQAVLASQLAPAMHDVGVGSVRQRHPGHRGSRLLALGQDCAFSAGVWLRPSRIFFSVVIVSIIKLIVDMIVCESSLPFKVGRLDVHALPAHLLDRQARLGLFEEVDDLLFSESALLHVRHSFGG